MTAYSAPGKGKKKTTGSAGGYGKAPEPPVPPPASILDARGDREADDDRDFCRLVVAVFAGDDPDEAAAHPIARAQVALAQGSFRQTKSTNARGLAVWTDLEPGEYQVEVPAPRGQKLAAKRETVTLVQGEEAILYLGFEAEESRLTVMAFHDAERCGDPAGQTVIKNLGFEIIHGGSLLAKDKTGEDGTRTLSLSCDGWVEVRPQGMVRTNSGTTLFPAAGDRQLVLLEPDKESAVRIAYVSGQAELTVEAVLTSDDANGEAAPLPGVSLSLYAPGSGVPVRTAVTEDWPVVFSDLVPGNYSIVVNPPASFQGRAVELVDGTQQRASVVVRTGHSTPLSLQFRTARGQVCGSVRGPGAQEGWEGIRLRLIPAAGGSTQRAVTTARGEFLFTDVPAGVYDLELADAKILHGQEQWVLAPSSQPRQRIAVKPGAPISVPPIVLALDEHTLTIQVFDPENKPLAYAAFNVLTEDGRQVGTFSTDENGTRTIHLENAGNYQVRYQDDGSIFRTVQVNKGASIDLHTRRSGGFGSRSGLPSGLADTVIDIPYPLLTESAPMASPSSWSAPSSGADLGQTVEQTLRSVLNWRQTGFNGDAKGFLAALNQSFTLTQTQGHTEFTWTPRSYAAVQSGLGALTGAQASIYTRAKVALDQAGPLLEGLYPLRPDADPQDIEAIRAIVRSGLTELINEFGIEGGPRVLRVDDLFRQLAGTTGALLNSDPEQVGGQLGQLAALFGLQRARVNTIDEEQNLTNFLIIVDYTLSLQQSWTTQRRFFTRGSGSAPFLGTQLVLVERSLSVVCESVQEVYLAMDSVFLGREERQVVELKFPDEPGQPTLFVAELLGWIDQVAAKEGPQLIKDGGKQGVISFQPTIDRLAGLALQALIPPQNPAVLPAGYRTARVQRALQELADHLGETSRLVQQIRQQAA